MPAYQSGGHYIIVGNEFKDFMIRSKNNLIRRSCKLLSINKEFEMGMKLDIHDMFKKIDDKDPLNPEQIASMLGMSTETVRRWCRSGKLSNYNFGGKYVVIGSDFKEFLKQSRSFSYIESGLLI